MFFVIALFLIVVAGTINAQSVRAGPHLEDARIPVSVAVNSSGGQRLWHSWSAWL